MTSKKKEQKEMPKLINEITLKPKQSVLNTETGNEESLEFSHQKYVVTADGEKEENLDAAIEQATELVGGKANILQALVTFATSRSYQDAKSAALASGSYITSDLKKRITAFMLNQPQFADLGTTDAWKKWVSGFKTKKAGALKILEIVRQSETEQFEL